MARRRWGCDEAAPNPVFPDPITGDFHASKLYNLHRCPAGQIGPEWETVVQTWAVFGGRDSFGPLPVAGGWLDQTQWFADVHAVLSGELVRYREAQDKKRQRERSVSRGR